MTRSHRPEPSAFASELCAMFVVKMKGGGRVYFASYVREGKINAHVTSVSRVPSPHVDISKRQDGRIS